MAREKDAVGFNKDVLYRAARSEDLPEMTDVFLTALGDMYSRNNITQAIPPRPAVIAAYGHILSTGIFRLAELDGRIAAIAGAVVRDSLWYLSSFWALPGLQGRNIGMPLLREVREEGVRAGAGIFFTWSSVDLTAMASYMKTGMVPGHEILQFEGTPLRLPALPAGFESAPLEKKTAMALDAEIRGTARGPDHDHWAGLAGRRAIKNGKVAGYYYINRGAIGPAAWTDVADAASVLTLACREALDTASAVRYAAPGVNHPAIGFAFDTGLRLVGFSHFLTTAPFGRMDRYLPPGPSLC